MKGQYYTVGRSRRTLTEWAAARGLIRETLRRRVQFKGMSMTEALSTPVKPMRLDLRGQRFGQLTVVGDVEPRRPYGVPVRYWPCRCDCGERCAVRVSLLRAGRVRSCPRCVKPWGQTFVVGGELLTVRQMAERSGRSHDQIRSGLRRGLSPLEAMQRPIQSHTRLITVGSDVRSVSAWGRFLGVTRERARQLAKRGRLELRVAERLQDLEARHDDIDQVEAASAPQGG